MITVDEVYVPLDPDNQNDRDHKLRLFQREFIDCTRRGEADIIQLIAPTGAGKTYCFEHLLKEGRKVLLLYPTNALIASQMKRFVDSGYSAATLSSKDLQLRGKGRSRELWGLIARQEIILTNPDIFQAIIGRMYNNPEENLLDVFRLFDYVVYDEFHAYQEFELSGVLTQIALFQNGCFNRVILSSATPKHEIVDLLRDLVRIAEKHAPPSITSIVARSITDESINEASRVRHKTNVFFHQGKILDHFDDIAQQLRDVLKRVKANEPSILLIFNTVRDSNKFFRLLHQEYPDVYASSEKDNGYDTNQAGERPELSKPILISTNKSEVGLDYRISMLFMEEGYNFDSFVQRFGRAARHEPADCHIYTKKPIGHLFPSPTISYQDFLTGIGGILEESAIRMQDVRTLFTFRQACAIEQYSRRKDDLKEYFSSPEQGIKYAHWLTFFSLLKKHDPSLANKNLDRLNQFLDDVKKACQSLRGQALQCDIWYTRGHEVRQTMYDLLSVLNRTPVDIRVTSQGIELEEINSEVDGPFIQAITLPYIPEPVEYPLQRRSLATIIDSIAEQALEGYSDGQMAHLNRCLRAIVRAIDPDRVLSPQEVILWDNRTVQIPKKRR
ncbi:type I-D CRISPR-associated helicase Cas3' [Methanoculleus sp.]|jgi:CRISPR-associated endonuclease/helicase Cas3|uniref:type I-D CRISPR-associated helicase Cas3' n=1 Tax=Methanoculleus sp. TaxID=90427 RepID=UPI001BD2F6CD|nr:type I-D CRISPR-associated helicase Cas3' [Methanoculleus sp.]